MDVICLRPVNIYAFKRSFFVSNNQSKRNFYIYVHLLELQIKCGRGNVSAFFMLHSVACRLLTQVRRWVMPCTEASFFTCHNKFTTTTQRKISAYLAYSSPLFFISSACTSLVASSFVSFSLAFYAKRIRTTDVVE